MTPQTAQTALDTATQFLQAGVLGLALAALIVALSAMGVAIFVIRYTGGRAKGDNELASKLISSYNTEIAGLIGETKSAIVKQTESSEKKNELTIRQTTSLDRQTEVIEELGANFRNYQTMTADGLESLSTNVLRVVNGFGTLDELIRGIDKAVKGSPEDHKQVLEALTHISEAQDKILTLIDSRLPESAKTATPTPMRQPTAPDDLGYRLLAEKKRETNQVPKIAPPPEDTTPPDKIA